MSRGRTGARAVLAALAALAVLSGCSTASIESGSAGATTPTRPSGTRPSPSPSTSPRATHTSTQARRSAGTDSHESGSIVSRHRSPGHARHTGPTTCHYIPFGTSPRPVSRPPSRPQRAGGLVLRLRLGAASSTRDVAISLDPGRAPCAVNSIVHLARAHFYHHMACDRLSTRVVYVLQCGDPTGNGYGGPGYRFADELHRHQHYPPGTVAMATGAPDTNGSQFFIVYRQAPLADTYTVIGHVTSGLDVIREIASRGSSAVWAYGDGRPHLPVHIVAAIVRSGHPSRHRPRS